MTKINWDDFPVIPGFDCLKWKAERQAEILRETEGMTREEIREYYRQAGDRAALRRKEHAARRAAENQT
jgi:hypothetical protein